MTTFKAIVLSGGKGKTEFLLRNLETKRIIWVYACNIKGARTWYPETACVYLDEGEEVDVETHEYYGSGNLYSVLTSGKLDSEQWAKVQASKPMFEVGEDGQLARGMF